MCVIIVTRCESLGHRGPETDAEDDSTDRDHIDKATHLHLPVSDGSQPATLVLWPHVSCGSQVEPPATAISVAEPPLDGQLRVSVSEPPLETEVKKERHDEEFTDTLVVISDGEHDAVQTPPSQTEVMVPTYYKSGFTKSTKDKKPVVRRRLK